MVFLIDDKGVPSVGQIVKVEQAADTHGADARPAALTATASGRRSRSSTGRPSTDNVGVTEYRVHRSTTAGFTPRAANRVATVRPAPTYTDTGLAAGTYYYKVVAADAAGNTSCLRPGQRGHGDTTAPTVSVSGAGRGRHRVRHRSR